MNKFKINNIWGVCDMKKISLSLFIVTLAACITVILSFAGCGKTQAASASSSSGSSQGRRTFNINNFKQQLDDNLASLVQDGTISSDQEDKIITAITDSMSSRMKNMQSRASGSSHSSRNGSRPSGSGSHSSWSGSRPSGSTNGGRGFGTAMYGDALSTLVKNGTISQSQSDAVTKALEQSGGGFSGNSNSSQS